MRVEVELERSQKIWLFIVNKKSINGVPLQLK